MFSYGPHIWGYSIRHGFNISERYLKRLHSARGLTRRKGYSYLAKVHPFFMSPAGGRTITDSGGCSMPTSMLHKPGQQRFKMQFATLKISYYLWTYNQIFLIQLKTKVCFMSVSWVQMTQAETQKQFFCFDQKINHLVVYAEWLMARRRHLLVIFNTYCQCASSVLCVLSLINLSHSIDGLLPCKSCFVYTTSLNFE